MSQQINLFNPIFLKQKKIFTVVPMAEALGIILLGTLAVAAYGKYRVDRYDQSSARLNAELSVKQARLASVTTEFAPRQKNQEVATELAATEARLRALSQVAALMRRGDLGNTQGYAEYFRALARQHVNGVWLTGVTITGAGSDIEVQGKALQAPQIPDYIGRLTSEKVMRGKTFSSLAIERPAAPDVPPQAPAQAQAPAPAPLTPLPPLPPALARALAQSGLAGLAAAPAQSTAASVPGTAAPAKSVAAPAITPFVEFRLRSSVATAANGREAAK